MSAVASTTPSYELLSGVPPIDVAANVQAAMANGRRATGIAAETARLRFGPGKLTPQEYFYYRLWDERVALGPAKAFVGKMAQHPMHVAAGSRELAWCTDQPLSPGKLPSYFNRLRPVWGMSS